jgi:uncharacterized RDD family membrane protein YckC
VVALGSSGRTTAGADRPATATDTAAASTGGTGRELVKASGVATAPGGPYAGFVTRAIAISLDAAIINGAAALVAAAASLVLSLFPLSHEARSAMVAIGGVLYAAWIVGYFVVFWTTTGETPGNRVMRIRVVCARGGTLRPFRALVRLAGMVISLPFLIGFLPVLVTERRRGLPDALAGTVVLSNVEPHERTDP